MIWLSPTHSLNLPLATHSATWVPPMYFVSTGLSSSCVMENMHVSRNHNSVATWRHTRRTYCANAVAGEELQAARLGEDALQRLGVGPLCPLPHLLQHVVRRLGLHHHLQQCQRLLGELLRQHVVHDGSAVLNRGLALRSLQHALQVTHQ